MKQTTYKLNKLTVNTMSSPHYHVEDYPSDEEDFDSDFYKEIERIQEENKKKELKKSKKTRKDNKRTTSAERNKATGKLIINLINKEGMRRRKSK